MNSLRWLGMATVLAACWAAESVAADPNTKPDGATSSRAIQGESAPRPLTDEQQFELLRKRIAFKFVDTPLNDAMEALSVEHNFPFAIIDLSALGLGPAPPVTLTTTASFAAGMTALLEPRELAWEIRDGIVLIYPQGFEADTLELRVYRRSRWVDVQELMESLATEASNDWIEGNSGEYASLGMLLIVEQTPREHRRIAERFGRWLTPLRSISPWSLPPPRPEWAVAMRALARPVNCNFHGAPLREAIDQLAAESDVTIDFSAQLVKDAAEWLDEPISLRVGAAPLGDVLTLLLLAGGLSFEPAEGGIRVTMRKEVPRVVATVYNARNPVTGDDYDALIEAIYTVDPHSWIEGGGYGTMEMVGDGRLKIEQDFLTHCKVQWLLAMLRSRRK